MTAPVFKNIRLGIFSPSPGWKIILDQIGAPWQETSFPSFNPSGFSLVIVNTAAAESETKLLENYIAGGGIVLYTPAAKALKGSGHFVRSIFPGQWEGVNPQDIVDIFSAVYPQENGRLISTARKGSGIEAYMGIAADALFVENKTKRKNFFTSKTILPNEIVSLRSKNTLRKLIQDLLERLHHQAGLPFVHKWYFPNNDPAVFTFRIDTDKGTKEQITEIYDLCRNYAVPATWFLDVKSHERWLDFFSTFDGQEIGLHCYEHIAYNSKILNKENFEKALDLLHRHKIYPKGITSPTGAWNEKIAAAMIETGFEYSSEFSYDYDNVPSFPFIGGAFSPVLQLPVHPVCIGSMLRSHYTPDEMSEYFLSAARQKLSLREPVCFYHHPTHRHTEVFEKVFQYINGQNIRKLSYRDYYEWWKKREKAKVHSAVMAGESLLLEGSDAERDVWVRVSLPDSREGIFPMQETIHFNSPGFVRRAAAETAPDGMEKIRFFDQRHVFQNVFDWWIKITE